MSYRTKTVLVTGANSGLGFEAATQLAEANYGRVILACRTLEKAEGAKRALVERVGVDPFETLEIDVSSIASTRSACDVLVERGNQIGALLLNAGMVSGDTMTKSMDGIEMSFASSIIGHHLMTMRLLEANMLSDGARIVIAGSEAARYDLPAMTGFTPYNFIIGLPVEFGNNLHEAFIAFAKAEKPELFSGTRYYAATKVVTSWWSAIMAQKYGERISVFTVSPGSNLSTNAGRHATGIQKFLFTKVMPLIGRFLGMDQPIALGAKRYLDVLHGVNGTYVNGKSYMSKPKKLIGAMEEMKNAHFLDVEHQTVTLDVLNELTGISA